MLVCTWLVTAAVSSGAHTDGPEFIESIDTQLVIGADGVLDVAHDIRFHPHGDEIRRGLFFELPDDVGPLSGFAARINDRDVEPERDGDALIVAAPEPLPVQRSHRMQISYRAAVPLRETSGGAEQLKWTPVISQFELPWRRASVAISWPDAPAPVQLPPGGERIEGGWRSAYPGPLADASDQAGSTADPSQALHVQWESGTFSAASVRKFRAHWSWRILLVLAILALWGLIHSFWRAVGRDPEIGSVRPSADSPSGISPAAARYIERMGFDAKTFAAALVSLRVKGRISLDPIKKDKKLRIARLGSGSESASPGEQALESALFADEPQVELKPGSSVGQKASSALSKALGREHRGRHFQMNNRERIWSLCLGAGLIAISISALAFELGDVVERDPFVVALGFLGLLAGVVIPLVYFDLMKAPTRVGLAVRREVEALRLHLTDPSPCREPADQFARLLPYAVALEAEEQWEARFEGRLGESDGSTAAEVVAWYRRIQEEFDSTAAIVTIIAASAATTSTTVSAGGASAGGV